MKAWKLAVLWAALIVAACSEVETVPTQSPGAITTRIAPADGEAQHSINVGNQSPPASVPPEYQHYTNVSVRSDAGFIGKTAYAQALVSYGGNNGSATIDLVARNAQGTVVGTNSGTAADSHVFPSNYSITANTTILLSVSCGITINATASGKVWDSFLGANQSMITWGSKSVTDSQGASQPACPTSPPPAPPPPAGGGDGSTPPPTTTPPPVYVPPYYSPKPGQYVCIVHNQGTDYEWRDCWWVESNDTRIATGGALRSVAGSQAGQPSFSSGDKLPSVFVIVSNTMPAGGMAVVERHKQGPYKNVLLVPSANFRPAELVRAMRYVYATIGAEGDAPQKEFTAVLKGTVNDADVSTVERDYAATFTAMLGKAKSGDIGAYGARPFLEIQLGEAKTK